MKIAVLAHLHHPIREPFPGGTETHTAVVVDALVARGHDVTLYAKDGSATAAELVAVIGSDFVFGSSASTASTGRRSCWSQRSPRRSTTSGAAGSTRC